VTFGFQRGLSEGRGNKGTRGEMMEVTTVSSVQAAARKTTMVT